MQLRNRFSLLLAFIVIVLIAPIALRSLGVEWDHTLVPAILSLAFVAMLVTALLTVCRDRGTAIITGSAIGVAALFRTIELATGWRWGLIGYQVVILLVTTYVIGVTVRFLFTSHRVSGNMITAAVSAYLLLGIVWALAYSLIDTIEPGSFRSATHEAGDFSFMQIGTQHSFYPLYTAS